MMGEEEDFGLTRIARSRRYSEEEASLLDGRGFRPEPMGEEEDVGLTRIARSRRYSEEEASLLGRGFVPEPMDENDDVGLTRIARSRQSGQVRHTNNTTTPPVATPAVAGRGHDVEFELERVRSVELGTGARSRPLLTEVVQHKGLVYTEPKMMEFVACKPRVMQIKSNVLLRMEEQLEAR
jgi:hypothetical protein